MTTIERWSELVRPARTPLRVTMLGLRGFPNVQGGVENHAQNLSLRLVELGCDVEVIVRSAYVPRASGRTWCNIKLVRLWSPRVKGVEAFLHTFLGVLRAAWTRPDILHIHAVGPALFTPLARAFGLRVVVTHHVLNYENEKWGLAARALLRLGERVGMTFANGRIAVSTALAKRMEHAYRVPVRVIPNGIGSPQKTQSTATLAAFGLQPHCYVLTVARVDEQKRQLDLIEAFTRASRVPWTLAIVGSADYSSEYAQAVAQAARRTDRVVMLGHQSGDALAELYSHAGMFVLPSSHEGQPIAVLEALSYGCPAILSDIPAHREIGCSSVQFFSVGDVAELASRLHETFLAPARRPVDVAEQERLMQAHDWRQIARHTLDVYLATLPGATREVRRDVSIDGRAAREIGRSSLPFVAVPARS
jgi:glycosyltransferase involved in cell wall biosynthesis